MRENIHEVPYSKRFSPLYMSNNKGEENRRSQHDIVSNSLLTAFSARVTHAQQFGTAIARPMFLHGQDVQRFHIADTQRTSSVSTGPLHAQCASNISIRTAHAQRFCTATAHSARSQLFCPIATVLCPYSLRFLGIIFVQFEH